MGYQTAATSDTESVIDEEYGGMWFLKDSLGTQELGMSVMELEPGSRGTEHDEGESGQEEVYVVVEGRVDFEIGEETMTLSPDEAIRVDAGTARQLHNRGDERAKLVIAGAPL